LLQSYGTTLLAPQQFLDAFELDSRGLRAVDNQRAKRRLGLPN
jgi:hypothetical protein